MLKVFETILVGLGFSVETLELGDTTSATGCAARHALAQADELQKQAEITHNRANQLLIAWSQELVRKEQRMLNEQATNKEGIHGSLSGSGVAARASRV